MVQIKLNARSSPHAGAYFTRVVPKIMSWADLPKDVDVMIESLNLLERSHVAPKGGQPEECRRPGGLK